MAKLYGHQRRHDRAVTIREMTRDDLTVLPGLLAQLGYDIPANEVRRRFDMVDAAPDHELIVAETAGRLVDMVHVYFRPAIEKPPQAVVQALVVDTNGRRAGVGRALMAAAEHWARERDLGSVALSSQIQRDDAHAFYARLGYRQTATSHALQKAL